MKGDPVITRHRLPHPYRIGLTVMWNVPLVMLIATIVAKRGLDPGLFDPRFVLPVLLMIAPSIYFWREGIDVLPNGLYRRIHVPHYYSFAELARWHYDRREDRHVLTIWDEQDQKIVECRAGHLTDFPALLETLEKRIP